MILFLVALTAFFVAAEFAYIRIRPTRVDQLIEEGNKKAIKVKHIITHIEQYLSTAQLGITMSALAMGWIGESAFEGVIGSLLSIFSLPHSIEKTISFALSFLVVTLFTVVVGELAPKNLAIQKAEAIAFFCAKPLIVTHKIMYPFTWVLNTSAVLIMKPLGLKTASESDEAHSEEELRMIVNESYMSGEINQSEYKYVNNIFEFDNRIAKEIMVPRTEIVALDKDDTLEESIAIFQEQNFTRYPIIDGDKDHIIGMINAKEVLTALATDKKLINIQHFMRPIIRVIDSIPIQDLLVKMQKERIHLAVLMDEYGGTSGLVTVEDILEEIVGEIRDEFDADEINEIRTFGENTTIVDAKVLVTEINDLLGTEIDDEDVDTIGGWFLTENYDAKTGDIVEFENYQFKIIEMDEHQIRFIEITKLVQNSEVISSS
ncbi:MAG: hypothetical protein K0R71_1772 [Bacillales bacterium]|jgi:CBS domain containing-hemolysin-like protein|nr:hypothetical protein [Bacillales bacterium]